ncbi:cutinase-domain-containing protein [Tothia fuscella]|uniref:cutinase n=1 Tax=Tothia fuscella TaxID=1048955 RepID=A0A9P4NVG4_9PEZI|nr:cutinase-domain-containing protein [Tothia fuscella]
MKYLALTCLASVALAAPSMVIERRQAPAGGDTSPTTLSEFTKGGCKGTILIFSRGTGEPSNLGLLGRAVARELKKVLPDTAVEGVNYSAGVGGNLTPQGADAAGIKMGSDLFKSAAAKCPNAVLLGGGYSQGAALQHRVVEALPKSIQDRIAAVVLYGDTKNKQDGGKIKNFPADKVKIFCNANDGVCGGGLSVNAGHLAYNAETHFIPGASFMKGKVDAMVGKSSAKGGASE